MNTQLQMDAAFEAQRAGGMAGEGEADTIKRMLVETNPVLLAITFIVREGEGGVRVCVRGWVGGCHCA
jgi:hypothetical protein